MQSYDHRRIEKKWQRVWKETNLYKTPEKTGKKNCFVLDMFPYPSGDGLHVGHPKGYIATDLYSRMKRMQGHNILHPMGWDAFGLPAENYAIAHQIHPAVAVKKNIARFKKQLQMLGFNYDWEREINTTDPKYYKWTQWIFLQIFKKGLAYQSSEPINWCPSCKTGLANEDLEDGKCERCGSVVEKRPIPQWVLKITDYADRLLADLKTLNWPEHIKEAQRNWIGRSEGTQIKFKIHCSPLKKEVGEIEVFTTRPETILGVSFLALAPDHRLASRIGELVAINPANGAEIPVVIAPYVIARYGTGAVMGVPAHDERDAAFAKEHNLPIPTAPFADEKTIARCGRKAVHYRLHDWVFSRQRYWGEPIPLIHCEACGVVPVPEEDLPVKLPKVESYEPTGTGESPLAAIEKWVKVKCPKCGGPAKRETNTMPQWAGSCWYYIAYCIRENHKSQITKTRQYPDLKSQKTKRTLNKWLPVNLYVGGAEHATRHLIYARFWHKFLFDIGVVEAPEPFARLHSVGLIQAADGRKMSKRYGNVVNPDEMVAKFGADALRVYEMFMGPFSQSIAWSTDSLLGSRRFLEKIWRLRTRVTRAQTRDADSLAALLHQTIKKVGDDIEEFKFNTAVSSLMILVNALEREEAIGRSDFEKLLRLLAPFAPHLAEELWSTLGHKTSISAASWPTFDPSRLATGEITIVVQVDGKTRGQFVASRGQGREELIRSARELPALEKWIAGKDTTRAVVVPDRLVNFVLA